MSRGLQTANAGVVYAPGSGDRRPAYGVQWLGNRRYGVSLWFSGKADRGGDIIDAPIPHNDFVNQDSSTSFGAEALYNVGSDNAALVLGVGVVVDRTYHTQVSNVTGWKWNGGSDTRVKPAAQVGCMLRMSNRVALSLGYDTVQNAYFGFGVTIER